VDKLLKEVLTEVAKVDSNNLETAFRDTNHLNNDQTRNEKVTPLVSNPRSSSIGDIFEIDETYHMKIIK